MTACFTICSNNYLAQATVLRNSLRAFEPGIRFFIFLCDRKSETIPYHLLADEVIPVEEIEPATVALASKYNLVELNTCLKPRVFEYLLLERKFDRVLFFDPDIQIFHALNPLLESFDTAAILLTPHILQPIPWDGHKPNENMFLNFGIYNLGFIGLRNNPETVRFLHWWKEHTYRAGFVDVHHGIFVDQLPVNLVPVFFEGVAVLKHPGLNMAPWNLHERCLEWKNDHIQVNEYDPLLFYHFSSFRNDPLELPLQYYDRYKLLSRPDIQKLYASYDRLLQAAGVDSYRSLPYAFDVLRTKPAAGKKAGWFRKSFPFLFSR